VRGALAYDYMAKYRNNCVLLLFSGNLEFSIWILLLLLRGEISKDTKMFCINLCEFNKQTNERQTRKEI
jgi:hypothetical protein